MSRHYTNPRRNAEYYFKVARPRRRKIGTYCESCTCFFAPGNLYEEPVMYFTYFVCASCLQTLQREALTKIRYSTPSLNDLEGLI